MASDRSRQCNGDIPVEETRQKVTSMLQAVFAGADHDIALDENGIVTLRFEDDLSLTVEVPELSPDFHLYAPVMHLPAKDRVPFFGNALMMNLFTISVPGTWLAYDADEDRMLLCATLTPTRCDSAYLGHLIEGMIDEIDHLRRRMTEGGVAAEPEGAAHEMAMVGIRI